MRPNKNSTTYLSRVYKGKKPTRWILRLQYKIRGQKTHHQEKGIIANIS
jgi:hypothetical protein